MRSLPRGMQRICFFEGRSAMVRKGDITTLLNQVALGDDVAVATLWERLQDDLRSMASQLVGHESDAVTLQTTQLVNEAFLRLHDRDMPTKWEHRGHFFGSVLRAMGQVLIDRARKRRSVKRGEGRRPISLAVLDDPPLCLPNEHHEDTAALVDAMRVLDAQAPRAGDVVWMRVIAGMTIEQVAAALDVSPRTVSGEWRYAKAWLKDRLEAEPGFNPESTPQR